jgi:hypothetical protein
MGWNNLDNAGKHPGAHNPAARRQKAVFPTIGNIFSNHWKTCGVPGSQRIAHTPAKGDGLLS